MIYMHMFPIFSFLEKMLSFLSRNDNVLARNENIGNICKWTINLNGLYTIFKSTKMSNMNNNNNIVTYWTAYS